MHPSDYVRKACIDNKPLQKCSLANKCNECKKEMMDLDEIDIMFASQFNRLYKLIF